MQISPHAAALSSPPAPAVRVDVARVDGARSLEALVTLSSPALPGSAPASGDPVVVVVDIGEDACQPAIERAVTGMLDRAVASGARIGIVVFDDTARLVRPADRPVVSRGDAHALRPDLLCGGPSNLGAGLARGVAEARRVRALGHGSPRLVLVLSGEPDQGVTDPTLLGRLLDGALADGIRVDVLAAAMVCPQPLFAHLADAAGTVLRTPHSPVEMVAELTRVAGVDAPLAAVAVTLGVRILDGFDGSGSEPTAMIGGAPAVAVGPRDLVADLGDLRRGERRTLGVQLEQHDDVRTPVAAAALRVEWTDATTLRPGAAEMPLAFGLLPGEEPSFRYEGG